MPKIKVLTMDDSPNQTFRKTAFYGDGYAPTYSLFTAVKQAETEHANDMNGDENIDLLLIGADSGQPSPAAQYDANMDENEGGVDESGFDQTL